MTEGIEGLDRVNRVMEGRLCYLHSVSHQINKLMEKNSVHLIYQYLTKPSLISDLLCFACNEQKPSAAVA